MKFMHLADVHLGADPDAGKIANINRKQEIWDTFRGIMTMAEQEGVELVLIAGDLFHRQPLMRELKEVDHILSKIYHGKTVIIAGNHDYLRSDSNYRKFEWNVNVTLLKGGKEGNLLDKVFFPKWNLEVYGLSYPQKEITEALYDRTCPDDNGRIHILLAHGGDEKHIPIGAKFLASGAFDYIALGHIHKPKMAKNGRYAYCGSPEPIDINETGKRGCVICSIDKDRDGNCNVMPVFIPTAKRQYIHESAEIAGNATCGALMDAMAERMVAKGSDNLFKWTITGYRDKDVLFDKDSIRTIGNVVEIEDLTKPAYDIYELVNGHRTDIMGAYILSFLSREDGTFLTESELSETEAQALYLGIQAMQE